MEQKVPRQVNQEPYSHLMWVERHYCGPLHLVGFAVFALFSTLPVYAETPFLERTTFTLPPQMKEVAKVLEDAGVNIVYGTNAVAPPAGISDAAKKMWVQLPQLPLQAHNIKQLVATRKMMAIGEKAAFAKFSKKYTIEDREINGGMTPWTTPTELKHRDKVMIFIHGGGMVVNTRKTQLSFQVDVANSLGVKVVLNTRWPQNIRILRQ